MGMISNQIAQGAAPAQAQGPQMGAAAAPPPMAMPTAVQGGQPMPPSAPAAPGGQPAAKSVADPAAVQKIVIACMNVLYNNGAITHAVEVIKASQPPAKGLADIAYPLLQSVFKRAQGQLQKQAFTPAAKQVLMMIVQSCQKAGLQIGGKEIAQAMTVMATRLMQESGLNTSNMQAAVGQTDFNAAGQKIDAEMNQGA